MRKVVLLLGHRRWSHTLHQLQLALDSGADTVYVHIDGPLASGQSKSGDSFFQEISRFDPTRVRLWYREVNVGAGLGIPSAVNWVLEHEQSTLVIEDDLQLGEEFFTFGWDMLQRYQDRPDIFAVSGFNPFKSTHAKHQEVLLSAFLVTWGWGTWRDRWHQYLAESKALTTQSISFDFNTMQSFPRRVQTFWYRRASELLWGSRHIWDYQLQLYALQFLTVYPSASLVRNVGFDNTATLRVRSRRIYSPTISPPRPFMSKSVEVRAHVLDRLIMRKFHRVGGLFPLSETLRKLVAKIIRKGRRLDWPAPGVVIVQTAVDSYRDEFLRLLKQNSAYPVAVLSGLEHFSSSVKGRSPYIDLRIPNIFLLKRRFLWQRHVLNSAIRGSRVVVELNPRIISTWFIALGRRLLGRRTIVWGHAYGRSYPARYGVGRHLLRRLCGGGVIAYTQLDAKEFRKHLGRDPVTVAPNSLYSRSQLSKVFRDDKANTLVCSGRLEVSKGPDVVMRAFGQCLQSVPPDITLTYIGVGPMLPQLEALASQLGIADRVIFRGSIYAFDDLVKEYSRAVCAVSGGYIGLNAIQALSFGIPLIYPSVPPEPHAPEIQALSPENSVSYEYGNCAELANLICDKVLDRQVDSTTQASGYDLRDFEYSVDNMVAGFLSALDSRSDEQSR